MVSHCSPVTRAANELYVCVYDGDYGVKWIQEAAAAYQQLTGVTVHAEADQAILTRIEGDLASPSYDIYMSHDLTWQQFAAKGLIEKLDDLYEMEVEGTGGKKFKDRLSDEAKRVSVFRDHYYKVCYTQGAGGLVYNKKMFEANNWTVPTTYDELVSLCATIKAANISYGEEGDKVVPFVWHKDVYYWDYVVFEWWAQLCGTKAQNNIEFYKAMVGEDGKYSTGYQVYNPDTHYKEFNQAYEYWYNLVAANTSYSNATPQTTSINSARSIFATGGAAMIPYAHWAKYAIEKENTLDPNLVEPVLMKTPRVAGSADYNYNVGYGDSMIVASKIPASSKLAAKKFLAYLATYDACKNFTKDSKGAFLAFDYSDVQLGDLTSDSFISSVYNKITTCENFNLVSTNPVAIVNSSVIMPWINNKYYYAVAFAKPDGEVYTPSAVATTIYNAARNSWASWVKKAGYEGK